MNTVKSNPKKEKPVMSNATTDSGKISDSIKAEVLQLLEASNYIPDQQWLHELKWQSNTFYYSVKRFRDLDGWFMPATTCRVSTVEIKGDFLVFHCHGYYSEMETFLYVLRDQYKKQVK